MASEWRRRKLGELVTFKTGKLDSNAAVPDGDYPFFTCSQETLRTNTHSFDTECVLLAGNNANGIFPLKYFHGKFDAYQRTYIVRPRDAALLSTKFLYYALRPKLAEFRSFSTGAATKFLTLTILNETEIQVPALATQRDIAGILSAYDELIENGERRIRNLESMARSLYREWFCHFRFPGHENHPCVASPLGDIPKGWEICCVRDLAGLVSRGPQLTYVSDDGIPVLNQRCVRNGEIELQAIQFAEPLSARKAHLYLKLYDILVNSMGVGTLGRVSRNLSITETMIIHNCITVVRAKVEEPTAAFLYYRISDCEANFESLGVGATGQTSLRIEEIEDVQFACPPRNVLARFDEAVRPMWKQIGALKCQAKNLRQTRDLLLQRLLSGQVEPETV